MPRADLKIVNALVVDGIGTPAFRADLIVADGKISDICINGDIGSSAHRTIDAKGHVVAPGFVDIHTHYDAQLFWDPLLGISPYHGVTTAVIGNCGFGVAPAHPDDHGLLIRTLEKVEGMPYESTLAGLEPHWSFVSFPEFLDAIEARGPAINICPLVPHTPIRIFVMGREADKRAATLEELRQMADLVREGMRAGAWGFSSSNNRAHIGLNERLAPSLYADLDEYRALVNAMAENGKGTFEVTRGEILNVATLGEMIAETGRPITVSALMTDEESRGSHKQLLEQIEEVQRAGRPLWPQVSCRPITFQFSLMRANFFSHTSPMMVGGATLDDLFAQLLRANTVEDRLACLDDPGFRHEFRTRTSTPAWGYLWEKTFVANVPGRPELNNTCVAELAKHSGTTPADIMLDLGKESRLEVAFVLQYLNGDMEEVEKIVRHPGTRFGLTDAGAHMAELCDACYPTDFLGRWVREEKRFSLEEAVMMLSSQAASVFEINDRGTLEPGQAADIVIFDPDEVGASSLYRVSDQPLGAERLVSDAFGIDHVIVNGEPVLSGGKLVSSKRPGRLLRNL